MSNQIATQTKTFDLSPQTFEQALTFSGYLAESDLVPKDFKGKPGNCLIAMQWGAELGLKPLQALQNLAIINGRPALWGDAVIAIVRGSPLCEYVIETDDGETATCKVKRKGEPEQIRTFSMTDADKAGLTKKDGPWKAYPKRMRQMRARAFALRDVFPDILRGMPVAEEVMDIPRAEERDMGVAQVVQPSVPTEPPIISGEAWAKTLKTFANHFSRGKTLDAALDWLAPKYTLTNEQKQELKDAYEQSKPIDVSAKTAPSMSYAQVMDAITHAADLETLDMARGFIEAVDGADLQAELHQKAAQKLAQIQNT